MFIVYGQRYNAFDPIIDSKTGEVIDDGKPKKIVLGRWADKKIAEIFAKNVKANTAKRSWNIWVE